MMQKKQHVTIKGTKDGLIFSLDDRCSFDSLLEELQEKLSSKHYQISDQPQVQVKLDVGNRFLDPEQNEQIHSIITENKNLAIERVDSNVISKEEAERLINESQIVSIAKVVRSGQVITVEGDLLLIGDVNPGGTIQASGNIFVLGALRGIAHAGCNGSTDAVISASLLAPAQLRIADVIYEWPKQDDEEDVIMECAYISPQSNQIELERVQKLANMRPQLTKFFPEAVEQSLNRKGK
ncbi:septum site-determining protein MinC [Halalkalibacterium ligniniphilum]|uniref:septum site-determining protein MinC n=1 Tax=Halalkalibacterium ligniniphilum TaxID=1134413 RepID=UPI000344B5BB|nr:septum site-determining protein MinC [Halalkalibacterium ligniniphilum]